jgi:pimeloyl-ACP methyl ester carboxylesterase
MDTSGSAEKRGERLIALLFPKAYRDANPAYAESFPNPTEQPKPAAIALQNRAIGEWKGAWGGLPGITCPALFVTGAEDELTPPRNAVLMTARVPGSWLDRFVGAGHGLMCQDPQGLGGQRLSQDPLRLLSIARSVVRNGLAAAPGRMRVLLTPT